jgi:hypothetical protein
MCQKKITLKIAFPSERPEIFQMKNDSFLYNFFSVRHKILLKSHEYSMSFLKIE